MIAKRALLIFLAIMATGALGASAAPILDQSNLGGGSLRDDIYGGRQLAQTFTVGIPGPLDSIVLDLRYDHNPPTKDLTVEIRSTTGGLPDGPAGSFASVQFDTSVLTDTFALYSIDFSGFYLPFAVGDQLAIVLSSEEEDWLYAVSWRDGYDDPYPGGKKYNDLGTGTTWHTSDYDAYFQTYVIPAPGPVLLGGIGVGLVSWLRRRRML